MILFEKFVLMAGYVFALELIYFFLELVIVLFEDVVFIDKSFIHLTKLVGLVEKALALVQQIFQLLYSLDLFADYDIFIYIFLQKVRFLRAGLSHLFILFKLIFELEVVFS